MIPNKTIHIVNGELLCDRQYSNYREASGFDKGYEAGTRKVMEWGNERCPHLSGPLEVYKKHQCDYCWQAQKKKWGIK